MNRKERRASRAQAVPVLDPAALLAKAQGLAEGQQLAEAERLLARLPDHPECTYRRAQLLTLLERPAEAEACFRAVLVRVPGHFDSVVGLAGSLVEQGRPAEAVPLLAAAFQAQPNSARIRYLYGVALDEAGQHDQAAPHLAEARRMVVAPAERSGFAPRELYLQVSRRCNLRCAMCGHEVWQSNSGFMEWEVFERALAEAKVSGIKVLHILSGQGEPFLHPKIFEMLEKAVADGFEVGIVTNGTPLTEERIRRLAGIGLAYLQFSFAGWDKASYEATYMGAKFEKTLANLKAMDQAMAGGKTRFVVKAVATEDWQATLSKTQAFLHGLGIRNVFTVAANNFGGHVEVGRFIEKHQVWSHRRIEHHRRMPCRLLLKAVGVFCDGTVTACPCYDSNAELKIGHIMEKGLAAIRGDAPFRRIVDAFCDGDVSGVPMCGKCDDPFG